MLYRALRTGLLLALLTSLALAQSQAGLTATKIAKIEVAVVEWMTKHQAPALSVAIVANHQLRWSRGFGLADIENKTAATAATAYRLASITKSITAVAVMQLVERGQLDLDAPVQKYCPAFPSKQWPVTSRQLLSHLGGVRHSNLQEVASTRHFETITDALGLFKDDPLLHEPGTKYYYSTHGYMALGCAIEGAARTSYLEYLRENIFKPAGMTETRLDDVYEIIPQRARGYRKTPGGEVRNAQLHDTSGKLAGGGLVSTVDDLARFAIAVQQGVLLKPASLDQMWTRPKTRDGNQLPFYALGWLTQGEGGEQKVWNDGNQAGTRTFLWMWPAERFAVALMTNLERAPCEDLASPIAQIVLREQ